MPTDNYAVCRNGYYSPLKFQGNKKHHAGNVATNRNIAISPNTISTKKQNVKKHLFILIAIFLLALTACQPSDAFTAEEREFILSGSVDEPFRVLQITNQEDSIRLRALSVNIRNYENDSVFQHFIKRLKSTLHATGGVGIAASQVGIKRNVFLFMRIELPDEPIVVAINPRIIATPDTTICFRNDGCLSIPRIRGNSTRYPWIEVEYFNLKGEKITEKLIGYNRPNNFTNIIFQHEYDHTKGVWFIDRLCEITENL